MRCAFRRIRSRTESYLSTPQKPVSRCGFRCIPRCFESWRRCRSGRFGQATGFLKAPSRLAENARAVVQARWSRGACTSVSRHVRDTGDRYRRFLAASEKNPVFAECNAIAPATARHIGALFEGSVCRYVDAGIIGGPPSERLDDAGPRFYAAGPYAHDLARLAEFGLDVSMLDGPIGAASGLKLSYAGLTKGITAIGAAMISAAVRDEVADALRDELARSQPQLLARLMRQVPAMLPKAYRWVSEMEEIAEFLGADDRGAMIYREAARLYDRIATGRVSSEDSYAMRALADFCASGERVK
jgi:hypothetical protein